MSSIRRFRMRSGERGEWREIALLIRKTKQRACFFGFLPNLGLDVVDMVAKRLLTFHDQCEFMIDIFNQYSGMPSDSLDVVSQPYFDAFHRRCDYVLSLGQRFLIHHIFSIPANVGDQG